MHAQSRFFIGCEPLEDRRLFSSVAAITWVSVPDAPVMRAEGSKATVNGKPYTVGGFINDETLAVTKELDVYDPVANTWTRLADMPVPETHGATAVIGDDFYIGGFFYNDGITASKLVYRYNTDTNVWTQMPSLPAGRGAAGMAVLDNTLHVWGGLTGQTTSASDHWSLDLNNISAGWVTRAPLPQALDHVGSVAIDGKIWSFGGFVDKEETDGNLNVVYTYDPDTDVWSTATPLPIGLGHIGPDTTVAGDKVVIAGGQIDASYEEEITTVIQYDPTTGDSVDLTNLPLGRKSAFAGFADGKLIVSCGNQNNAPYLSQKTWVADYDPDSATDTPVTPTPPVVPVTPVVPIIPVDPVTPVVPVVPVTPPVTTPVDPVVPVVPVTPPLPTNSAGPDFSGTVRLKLPNNALAGDKGTAIVTVKNSGHMPAIGKMSVEINLSTDGTTVLDQIGTRANIPVKLGVDRAMVVNIPFTLPTTLASDNYIILSQIDAANQFVEVNETNNTAASAAVAVAARVITVNASATAAPSSLRAGQVAGMNVILSDIGTVAATGLANFTITATGPDGSTQTVLTAVHRIGVPPHGKRGIRLTFRVPKDWVGAYTLQLQVAPTTMATSLDDWSASATTTLQVMAFK